MRGKREMQSQRGKADIFDIKVSKTLDSNEAERRTALLFDIAYFCDIIFSGTLNDSGYFGGIRDQVHFRNATRRGTIHQFLALHLCSRLASDRPGFIDPWMDDEPGR